MTNGRVQRTCGMPPRHRHPLVIKPRLFGDWAGFYAETSIAVRAKKSTRTAPDVADDAKKKLHLSDSQIGRTALPVILDFCEDCATSWIRVRALRGA
jgi:hypothetical protein